MFIARKVGPGGVPKVASQGGRAAGGGRGKRPAEAPVPAGWRKAHILTKLTSLQAAREALGKKSSENPVFRLRELGFQGIN